MEIRGIFAERPLSFSRSKMRLLPQGIRGGKFLRKACKGRALFRELAAYPPHIMICAKSNRENQSQSNRIQCRRLQGAVQDKALRGGESRRLRARGGSGRVRAERRRGYVRRRPSRRGEVHSRRGVRKARSRAYPARGRNAGGGTYPGRIYRLRARFEDGAAGGGNGGEVRQAL